MIIGLAGGDLTAKGGGEAAEGGAEGVEGGAEGDKAQTDYCKYGALVTELVAQTQQQLDQQEIDSVPTNKQTPRRNSSTKRLDHTEQERNKQRFKLLVGEQLPSATQVCSLLLNLILTWG